MTLPSLTCVIPRGFHRYHVVLREVRVGYGASKNMSNCTAKAEEAARDFGGCSVPVTPAHARPRAHVERYQLCAYVSRFGVRCVGTASSASDYCQHHRSGELLQLRELWVLRDPRTGEPMEVG